MSSITLEHGKTRIYIHGSDELIAKERTAFYDFVRSVMSVSPEEQFHVQECKLVPTWTELKQAADQGRLSGLVKSGDRLPLVLKNGEKIDLDVGRDESGKIYFIFHYLMKDEHCMNETLTNASGWRDCEMRRYANEEIYNLLPEEVKAVIVPTRIVQIMDGERIETNDKLFCLSSTEVFGKDEYWSKQEPEDTQIDIFRDLCARVKAWSGGGEAYTSWWWLRSVCYNNYFNYVDSNGYDGTSSATNAGGVALSFCIEHREI